MSNAAVRILAVLVAAIAVSACAGPSKPTKATMSVVPPEPGISQTQASTLTIHLVGLDHDVTQLGVVFDTRGGSQTDWNFQHDLQPSSAPCRRHSIGAEAPGIICGPLTPGDHTIVLNATLAHQPAHGSDVRHYNVSLVEEGADFKTSTPLVVGSNGWPVSINFTETVTGP
jgi:hypothetical protein